VTFTDTDWSDYISDEDVDWGVSPVFIIEDDYQEKVLLRKVGQCNRCGKHHHMGLSCTNSKFSFLDVP